MQQDTSYARGSFTETLTNLPLSTLLATSAARRVVRASRELENITGADAAEMMKAARQLEDAADDLRTAAASAFLQPVRLQAAE